MLNYKFILRTIGFLITVEGLLMILPLLISIFTGGADTRVFLISSIITIITGALMCLPFLKANKSIGKHEGYLIITLVWIFFSIFGGFPFFLSEYKFSFTDSFFEAMSGFTTTGATIIDNLDQLSKGLLFWRSFTQWIGGMGIIFMSLAILPMFGISGMSLIPSESSEMTIERINPKIRDSAKIVFSIYLILTAAETLLLTVGGMNFFDSVCHSFSTISTGGFSTKQGNIGYWASPFIQYTIIFFMILAGTNFTLLYFSISGSLRKLFTNEEFKYYLAIILLFTVIIGGGLLITTNTGIENTFRNALFQVTSIITTTGFVTDNYNLWNGLLSFFILFLMFLGGTSGSASGGMKVMRVVLIFKSSYSELKRLLHPNAIIPVRCNQRTVSNHFISNILVFCFIYILIFLGGSLFMMLSGIDYQTSMGAVASCLGNIGPGIGSVGPFSTYSQITPLGKWFLSFLMLIGRLEIFAVLSIFSPYFWRR